MTIGTKRAAILAVLMLAGLQARLYYEKINEYLETYLTRHRSLPQGKGAPVPAVLRGHFLLCASGETVAVYKSMRYNNNRVFIRYTGPLHTRGRQGQRDETDSFGRDLGGRLFHPDGL